MKTGLVLSGGGGKGIYQAGMLKVLYEAGLLDDVCAVSGCSIGTINAVLYAVGGPALVGEVWQEVDMKAFLDLDTSKLSAGDSHFSRRITVDMIRKYFDESTFTDDKLIDIYAAMAACPAGTVSTDRITEDELRLLTTASVEETYRDYTIEYAHINGDTLGDAQAAMLASTAMPVIYAPVNYKGRLYVDGGVKDNVPVKPLYDMGIRRFIVIELKPVSTIRGTFPDAEIIDILPSHDLGSLISGTMNFTTDYKFMAYNLALRDGRRYIKTLFEKDPDAISMEKTLAESDYNAVLRETEVQKKYRSLQTSVDRNMDTINSIIKKYE